MEENIFNLDPMEEIKKAKEKLKKNKESEINSLKNANNPSADDGDVRRAAERLERPHYIDIER